MTYRILVLYWLVIRLSERLFTNDADVNSAFAASSSHYYYALVYTGATVLLAYLLKRDSRPVFANTFIKLQVTLFSYAVATSVWSPEALVSAGQAVYSFYGLLFAMALCKYAAYEVDTISSLSKLIRIWGDMLLIDYVIDVGFFFAIGNFGPPPIDEKALVAVATFILGRVIGNDWLNARQFGLLWMFAAGRSFSALIASTIIFSRYMTGRVGKVIGILFAGSLIIVIYEALRLVEAGQLSIYGKSWEYILSGSGRFRAWEYLYVEILGSDWGDFVFGHGFMSERSYLSNQYLTWAIDTHSNILQSLYGLGIIGTTLMVLIWLYPFLVGRSFWAFTCGQRFWKVLLGCHTAFIIFGLTSSHYFSRPSISAIFITSCVALIFNLERRVAHRPHVTT